ncbi:hypothetical protein ZIOFF_063581 [Zingiber officinale]|uniref:Uncharacterized protein n=1 Tax=Zingiber officinale TaxID=94328 RepID=A0A8J5KK94_ZINOF|nr:hypothetical protein ZIOFF_063581 [Zingiber officinale]
MDPNHKIGEAKEEPTVDKRMYQRLVGRLIDLAHTRSDIAYANYIKFEESSGDPVRIQILYERAVSRFPVSSDLWLGYTSYLDQNLKVPTILRSVYSRATRNCTWVGELWVHYLLSLERMHATEKELSDCQVLVLLFVLSKNPRLRRRMRQRKKMRRWRVLFTSLLAGEKSQSLDAIRTILPPLLVDVAFLAVRKEGVVKPLVTKLSGRYLDLFLTRVDGLRRRMSLAEAKKDGLDYTIIRETLQRATEYLSPDCLSTDELLCLHSYWARLEVSLGKDIGAACGVWENLLKKRGTMLEVWQSYITMELELGQINEARSIYRRCYTKRFSGTGSEDICYSWLRFERENGTLEDYDTAQKKVAPRLKELKAFRAQQEAKSDNASLVKQDNPTAADTSRKRKIGKVSESKPPPEKRKKYSSEPSETSEKVPAKATDQINIAKETDEGSKMTRGNSDKKDVSAAFVVAKHGGKEFTGSVTFAVPRALAQRLDHTPKDAKPDQASEQPKSND